MTICNTLCSTTLKKAVNSIFGGTPDISLWHPCVPQQPKRESLILGIGSQPECPEKSLDVLSISELRFFFTSEL
jgi:hypothetical protein